MNYGRVFLKMPGIPVGTKIYAIVLKQLKEISAVYSFRMNVVGFDDALSGGKM